MADFLQTLINAIALGSLFALIALGYTMVYGVLKLINFAHSDIVVLGAWLSVTVSTVVLPWMGVVPDAHWWSGAFVLLCAMGICGLLGFLIERLAYRPLRKAPRLNALITAIGISLFLQNFDQLKFTIIPNEHVVTSGEMLERGSDAKTVKLAVPVTFAADTNYMIRVKKDNAGKDVSGTNRKIVAPAGTYEAKKDIAIDSAIGRSETRDAKFELLTVANHPPLQLPFGAMPAAMPALFKDKPLVVKLSWLGLHDYELKKVFISQTPYGQLEKPVRISKLDAIIVGTAVFLMIALQLLVYKTPIGTAMRAVSYNMETSGLMGIPVDRIVSFTFVTGTALAAAAGFLFALRYQQVQQPAHNAWVLLGLTAFVAAVVGGIGNIRGATMGGFLIAFIQQFGVYLGQQAGWGNASAYQDVFVFLLLIVVLLVKPTGIFGSTVREKV